ncbi:hypothetical protein AB1Y20_022074 [Prymnesium parvum]|uniref:Uncharacterized protein n=1 Tax=Prymnesium parvum TaxID=97485 RepID=A0AB34JHX2_PRYPA
MKPGEDLAFACMLAIANLHLLVPLISWSALRRLTVLTADTYSRTKILKRPAARCRVRPVRWSCAAGEGGVVCRKGADLIYNAPSSPPKDLPTWVSEMLDADPHQAGVRRSLVPGETFFISRVGVRAFRTAPSLRRTERPLN